MSAGETTTDAGPFDPFGEVVGLVAGPIAAGIRSVEQLRKGVDEFLRGVENFNATMENLNETAARVNRLLNDIEEPVRAAMPQITRTVRTADELSQRVASFPVDIAEFMRSMMELSRHLAPLVGLAESAGGMFGLRLPGFGLGRQAGTPTPPPAPAPAAPAPTPATSASAARRSTTKRSAAAKRPASKRSAAKKSR